MLSPSQNLIQAKNPSQSSVNPVKPKFSGLPAGFVATLPVGQKLASRFLSTQEGGSGTAMTAFLQDTGTVWAPKIGVSRSWTEAFETTFLEFSESALFYFASGLLAQFGFSKWFKGAKDIKKDAQIEKHLMTPLEDVMNAKGKVVQEGLRGKLANKTLRQVIASKAGIILASVGVAGVVGEYGLNFVKNLATVKLFHKSNFSHIVNLSSEQSETQNQAVADKAIKRIKQTVLVGLGLVGAAFGLARFGTRFKGLEKPLERFVKTFDFTYSPKAKWLKYGLSMNQLKTVIVLGVVGYYDAARDRLEQLEVMSRLAIVAPYLASGGKLFERLAIRLFKKDYPEVLEPDGKTLRSLAEVYQSARDQAKKALIEKGIPLTESALNLETANQKIFKGKMALTMGPLLFGMATVGTGVALLMRFWTRYRFEHDNQKAQAGFGLASSKPMAKLSGLSSFRSEVPVSNSSFSLLSFRNPSSQALLTRKTFEQFGRVQY